MSRGPGDGSTAAPRLDRLVVRVALGGGEVTETILYDLAVEYRERARTDRRAAARWHRRQAIDVATRGGWARLRGQGWQRRATGPGNRWGWEGSMGAVERAVQDLREAARALLRGPRYALSVIVTFGLAVGANVAVFSTVNGVLLRPLSYPRADRLVAVTRVFPKSGAVPGAVSYPDFTDWRARAPDLSMAAAYVTTGATYYGGEFPERLTGVLTTPDLFRVLQQDAAIGRTFAPGEGEPGDGLVILSDALWRQHFGSDPEVVGTQIRLGSRTSTVLGVMPPGFSFPDPKVQYWAPLPRSSVLEQRGMGFLSVVARVADGRDVEGVEARLKDVVSAVDVAAGRDDGRTVAVTPLKDSMVVSRRALLFILLGAVALVLAIACANIASLSLSRGVKRSRELAVRVALGAGRGRIARLLLWESALLAMVGAAFGVVLAFGLLEVILRAAPQDIPRIQEVTIDGTVLLFATGITLSSLLLFGMAPALRSARLTLEGLRGQGRELAGDRAHDRTQRVLVVVQVAVAMVLLSGSALLANSFVRLTAVNPGFDAGRVLSMTVPLPASRYGSPGAQEEFFHAVHEQLARVPDIEASGTSQQLPFSSSTSRMSYEWAGAPLPDEERPVAGVEVVGGDYFRAMGIPIIMGRSFGPDDRPDGARVAVVNETLARRQWPDQSPIGKRLTFDGAENDLPENAWFTVIGVVPPVVRGGLDRGHQEEMYLSRGQASDQFSFVSASNAYLVVRGAGDPTALATEVRSAIRSVDAEVPVVDIETAARRIDATLAEPRFRLLVIASFSLVAGAVAVFGLYSLMTFVVAGRTKEIGVRVALGASPRAVRGTVVGQTAGLTFLGVVLGVGLSALGTRFVAGLLYGVTPHDPLTLCLVGLALVAVGAGAGLGPAAYAARVDPVRALARE